MPSFEPIPDETPLNDRSELKIESILYRSELNKAESLNISKALSRYFGESPRSSFAVNHQPKLSISPLAGDTAPQ